MKRIILIILAIFIFLATALTAVVYFAKNQVQDKIVQKAQQWGWELSLQEMHIPRFSEACIEGMVASAHNKSASLRVQTLCIPLNWKTIQTKRPQHIRIHAMQIDVNDPLALKDNIPSGLQTEEQDAEQRPHAQRQIPPVDIYGYEVTIRHGASSLRCKEEKAQWAEVEADAPVQSYVFQASLDCTVDFKHEKTHLQTQYKGELSTTLYKKQQTIGVYAALEPAIETKIQHDDQNAEIHLSALLAEWNNPQLMAGVENLKVHLPNHRFLHTVEVKKFAAHIATDSHDDPVEKLLFQHPMVALNLHAVLESESVKNSPLLGDFHKFLEEDDDKEAQTKKPRSRRKKAKDVKPVKIKKNPIKPETLHSIKIAIAEVKQKVEELPTLIVKEGSVVLDYQEKKFSIHELSFDSSELFSDQDQEQNIHLAFGLRGAQLTFDFAFSEDMVFPTIAFDIKDLSAKDLFTTLSIPQPEDIRGSFMGSLKVQGDDEEISIETHVKFEDFAIFHPKISKELIHDINASAKSRIQYIFNEDKLNVNDLELVSGPVKIVGELSLQNVRSYPVLHFNLHSKKLPCEDIPRAIPPGLMPSIDTLIITGDYMSPEIFGKVPIKDPITLSIGEKGFQGCHIESVEPHRPEELNEPHYTFTFTQYTTLEEGITVGPGTNTYVPLSKIPTYVQAAMYLTEDKRFFDHGPLRMSFIERAMRLNLEQGRYVYGGSTISQQLTKNLFLDRNKNLSRKLEEAFIAWRLEAVVPKTRIFELYINMIEFGPDIYGIKNASLFYFNKSVQELTILEGAYLASLKVAPSKGGRFYKSGFSKKDWWHRRMKYIIKILAENGYVSPAYIVASYPWIPEFYYPDPEDKDDFRNQWLEKHKDKK